MPFKFLHYNYQSKLNKEHKAEGLWQEAGKEWFVLKVYHELFIPVSVLPKQASKLAIVLLHSLGVVARALAPQRTGTG